MCSLMGLHEQSWEPLIYGCSGHLEREGTLRSFRNLTSVCGAASQIHFIVSPFKKGHCTIGISPVEYACKPEPCL